KAENVGMVASMSLVNGVATYEDKRLDNGVVVATTANLPELTNQTVDFGEFLTDHDEGRFFAVIGPGVAEQLFGENVPIGKSIDFRGQRFTVKGVMTKFDSTPLVSGIDFNNSVFISYATGKALSEGNAQVVQILVKPAEAEGVDRTQASIESALLQTHGGQQDFSVLKQDETISAAGNILTILTALVAAVATISLVVGGIGVMNIMLVSVTERTQEIGIRKAVGATNHQILMQFLVESMVLSLAGGALGVLLALVINFVLRVTTSLEPVLSPIVIVVAMLMSLVVGVIFGVVPAMKAARKHPIDALRFE
ncbi:FtsX-like permease family protein, partial [Candidatus Saccharibacteria bacterium]|nr:FtsX-like permease family protein [Candidatus Saccharibacteria bacterium]